jgi:acyl-CoA synthetase (AMP-forming)/AMP-acid ligase II
MPQPDTGVNIAVAHDAIAAAVPDRECIVWRDRRYSWSDTSERTNRLASCFLAHGLGAHGDPTAVAGWESAQDLVALYLTNCNEYLEGMLGGYKARVAPFNVNYRYVTDELVYLFTDARPRAIVFHARYASTLAAVLAALPERPSLLLQVADESGAPLLAGALDYDDVLAAASSAPPATRPAPDDLYVVYTGGTTGMPKGALWRQTDFLASALGITQTVDELVADAPRATLRALPAPPLMHGAAHWHAISAWLAGGTIVMQDTTDHLDPHDVLRTVERERVTSLQIVGDAFARPLLDAQRQHGYDLSSLRHIVSGGAVFTAALKQAWVDEVPGLRIIDIVGSSESGRQGLHQGTTTGTFAPSATAAVLDAERTRRLDPGDDEIGWLAQTGPMPRGYLNDPEKTRATYPIIDGTRYGVAGDRARIDSEGRIVLLGRESVTINTGGEKVFAEEVEQALKHHPDVIDALVVGRASERWGQEVVAVAHIVDSSEVTDDELRAVCAEHVARYKLPKTIVRVPAVQRSASGKPDYVWALSVVNSSTV